MSIGVSAKHAERVDLGVVTKILRDVDEGLRDRRGIARTVHVIDGQGEDHQHGLVVLSEHLFREVSVLVDEVLVEVLLVGAGRRGGAGQPERPAVDVADRDLPRVWLVAMRDVALAR
jgi:hypothetical protein